MSSRKRPWWELARNRWALRTGQEFAVRVRDGIVERLFFGADRDECEARARLHGRRLRGEA